MEEPPEELPGVGDGYDDDGDVHGAVELGLEVSQTLDEPEPGEEQDEQHEEEDF